MTTITIKAISAKITGLKTRSTKFNDDLDQAIAGVIDLLVVQDLPCVNQANRLLEVVNAPTKPRLVAYLKEAIPFKYHSEKGFTKLNKKKIEACKLGLVDQVKFSEYLTAERKKDNDSKPPVDYFARTLKNIDALIKKSGDKDTALIELDSLLDLILEKKDEIKKA